MERQRFLRLKSLLTGVTKKERKKKLGNWRGPFPKGLLDDVSGEGFSELDPAVLALEEADQHVLLGLAAFELPDLRSLGNVSTALWTDKLVEMIWQLVDTLMSSCSWLL